jgi:acyl-CoA synthetase (AMP-forming)/AMP-acid ligase II
MTNSSVRRAPRFEGPPLEAEPGIGGLTLPALLDEVAGAHAAREALVHCGAGGDPVRWTYQELAAQARRVARALVAADVDRGTRVGVLMPNRPEWLAAVFGTALCGGVAVALSTFSTREELEQQLRLADVSILLLQETLLDRDFLGDVRALRADGGTSLPFLRRVIALDPGRGSGAGADDWNSFLASGDAIPENLVAARAAQVSPADPALVFFSSGSTGEPKGILHAHRAAALQSWRFARFLDLHPDARCWTANAFFWSGNFAMIMGATLAAGGCLVLQEHFEPGEALRLLEQERVTFAFGWPHQHAQLEANPGWADADLSALRYVDPARALARHPSVQPDPEWSEGNAYGLSETFTIVAGHPSRTPLAERDASTGYVLAGSVLRIVDPQTGEALGAGETGEIAVKGATLMLGYLKRLPEEWLDADGFFHSKDAGWIDTEGRLHWEGRIDDIVKTGGANVSPVEVDAVLVQHPGLRTASSVGVPHPTLGQELVACVVAHADRSVDEANVRSFARERLSAYKVPRRVLFFEPDDLALTASAKVRLVALRELAIKRLEGERGA